MHFGEQNTRLRWKMQTHPLQEAAININCQCQNQRMQRCCSHAPQNQLPCSCCWHRHDTAAYSQDHPYMPCSSAGCMAVSHSQPSAALCQHTTSALDPGIDESVVAMTHNALQPGLSHLYLAHGGALPRCGQLQPSTRLSCTRGTSCCGRTTKV